MRWPMPVRYDLCGMRATPAATRDTAGTGVPQALCTLALPCYEFTTDMYMLVHMYML